MKTVKIVSILILLMLGTQNRTFAMKNKRVAYIKLGKRIYKNDDFGNINLIILTSETLNMDDQLTIRVEKIVHNEGRKHYKLGDCIKITPEERPWLGFKKISLDEFLKAKKDHSISF